jgi:hypothetical protein
MKKETITLSFLVDNFFIQGSIEVLIRHRKKIFFSTEYLII